MWPQSVYRTPPPQCTETYLELLSFTLLPWAFSGMTYNPFEPLVLHILPPGSSVIHLLSQKFLSRMLP